MPHLDKYSQNGHKTKIEHYLSEIDEVVQTMLNYHRILDEQLKDIKHILRVLTLILQELEGIQHEEDL